MKHPKRRAKCMECERLREELSIETMYYGRTIEVLKKESRTCREQTVMLDVLVRAFERVQRFAKDANDNENDVHSLYRDEFSAFVRFFDDVNLILAGSRDTLCGSKWINAAALLEARNRYAKAMEEIQ